MDEKSALAAFHQLKGWKETTEGYEDEVRGHDVPGYDEPMFDVRLTAGSRERSADYRVERAWRIRVTAAGKVDGQAEWELVFSAAKEFGATVRVENSGLELV